MNGEYVARIQRLVKRALYSTPLGTMRVPRYRYMFSPPELMLFCKLLREVAPLGGPVGEVGCFRGDLTVFLNRYLDNLRFSSKYFAFDTFEGFTEADIRHETESRHKNRESLKAAFSVNSQQRFDETMRENHIARVESRKVDANVHTFEELRGCCFCLIDVDLYKPVKHSLNRIYEICQPGGYIVVDDCRNFAHHYDGAYQAYSEFVGERGLPLDVRLGKLGVIRKAPLA